MRSHTKKDAQCPMEVNSGVEITSPLVLERLGRHSDRMVLYMYSGDSRTARARAKQRALLVVGRMDSISLVNASSTMTLVSISWTLDVDLQRNEIHGFR